MTAEDILADAERLTKTYAKSITDSASKPRVFLLFRNDALLGIFSTEAKAVKIAVEIMANSATWQQWIQIGPTLWESQTVAIFVEPREVQ